jgi:RNA polymerase sigma-70 factor (ECF subfamily)
MVERPQPDEPDQHAPTPAPDDDLIDGLRAGNDGAYARVIREHGGWMLSVALRIVRNPDDARDCLQDALLRAFRHIDSFERRSSLRTWLHRIVVNAALGRLRTRRRHPEESLDDLMPVFDEFGSRVEAAGGPMVPVETLVSRREVKRAVHEALDRLPDDYRAVLLLRDIEGLDTKETATLLDTSVGSVKTRLHRARAALKRLLDPVLEGAIR